ncbi:hypothetical protein GCM10023084_69710 [Streptomyces lacrimifluminis]|uniref:Uncharacterized protein n=1 Tax=Streptomyces lacrimifluminis TaxID=1500077 RepID=A0A917UIW7_9ACTN|nr:hypothetical protein [Streptomyces lacrimifluminis]GGJ61504.1 hypothetical protein GCM10012282_68480 [Streptomyces lacrimifluminis]
MSVLLFLLIGVLVLTVGGCVCVVWAARGGPPWVRAVATATLVAGRVVSKRGTKSNNGSSNQGSDGND